MMEYKFIKTDYLESVSEGDPEIIREITSIFKDQVVEMYNEMVALLEQGNYSSLGFLAHKAKSSVAIMGMDDLAIMLKNFELQAKDGKGNENYESYIKRFKYETDGAVLELESLISKLPSKN
jgi:HPt (histidine-containing phosphotransfer) domain-containing protein